MARFRRWLQNADPGRVMQIALACLILAGSLIVHVNHGSAPLTLVLDTALYVGVIVAARWGLPGALGIIPLSLSLFATAPDVARLGEYALFLPLIGGASRGPIRGWIAYTALALVVLTGLTASRAGQRNLVIGVMFWALGFGMVWIVAIMFRQVAQNTTLRQDMALTEQRLAIARDVHDTVAHHATVIAMRAEQALLRDEHDRADLEFIAATARHAVDDIRATLATLTDTTHEVAVLGRSATLAAVVQRAEQRLTASNFTIGTDLVDEPEIPPDVLATIDAILREAINNIVKHGEPTQPCGIIVEATGETLEITLVNVRRITTEKEPRDVPFGIMGMQARAGQIGGSLDAVASADRWLTRLTVALPSDREEA